MDNTEYHRPKTLAAALALLASGGGASVPVAGATDVWVNLKTKKQKPASFVSLRGVAELNFIREEAGSVEIGAATPHAALEDSELVRALYPALHAAASAVGSRQVRNVGTIGGNLCNAAPSADTAVPLFLYDAELKIEGPGGGRTLKPSEFFVGPGKTDLKPGELLVSVIFPKPAPGTVSGYIKHTRRKAMELPLLGVGALASIEPGTKKVSKVRIALGVAGPVPMRIEKAEAALLGAVLDASSVAEAARIASEEARVRDSWRAGAWYRREMIKALVPRILLGD